ncbi:hypothetical protein LX36DRAFT_659382, partial [Colletotrichum falcatum]
MQKLESSVRSVHSPEVVRHWSSAEDVQLFAWWPLACDDKAYEGQYSQHFYNV